MKLFVPPISIIPSQGNTTVFLGDSITLRDWNPSFGNWGVNSFVSWACNMLQGKIRFVANAGIQGNTTKQMLSRIGTDVIQYKPSYCVVLGGTNDVTTAGVTPSNTLQNIATIIDILRQSGIRPILCSIPPRGDTPNATTQLNVATINSGIASLSYEKGVPFVDFHSVLIDPTSYGYKNGATWSADGIHPLEPAAASMGQLFANQLSSLFNAALPYLTTQITDPINLLINGVFIGDANADGRADNWNQTKSANAIGTFSLDNSDTTIVGNKQVINCTANPTQSDFFYLTQDISNANFSVGDTCFIAGRYEASTMVPSASSTGAIIYMFCINGSNPANIGPVWHTTISHNGLFALTFSVPLGTTTLRMAAGMVGATGTLKVSQFTVLNLTKLGLN